MEQKVCRHGGWKELLYETAQTVIRSLWEVMRMDDLGKAALSSGGESKDTFPGHQKGSLDVDSSG